MKNQAKKMTKAQKQYVKDHKKPKRKVVKRKTAPKTQVTKPAAVKNKPVNNNLRLKKQDAIKDGQTIAKTPRKRQNGQAQRQIKVINIRI